MRNRQITFCLTSCGRFDLLQETLRSFFENNAYPIAKYIIVEDSGYYNAANHLHNITKEFSKSNFHIIVNEKRIGQIPSIDRAYREVDTPYIFHCEDDWKFTKPGFMEPSLDILEHIPEAVMVWLRDPLDVPQMVQSMQLYSSPHRFFDVTRAFPEFTLNFNPGLRRFADYRKVGNYQKLGTLEHHIGNFYYSKNKKIILLGGSPYYRHIGKGASMSQDDPYRTHFKRQGLVFIPRFLSIRLGSSIRKRYLRIFTYVRLLLMGERPSVLNLLKHLW